MHSSGLTGSNEDKIKRSSGPGLFHLFRSDPDIHEGVPLINIWLLRLLFTLMFLFLTFDSWRHIWNHKGPWNDVNAAAWCMWGSYSVISFIGVMRPLKMLPIVIFEIIYKTAWLLIVAYPLWIRGELAGSPVEGMARVFIWVLFPIAAMPWRYFFRTYIRSKKSS
ncbi:MAG: hypothetical protein HZA79_03220 [Sphingobacteriales bacterium]|nr:hypothetical protein [Sphingobacteriales bacterium]